MTAVQQKLDSRYVQSFEEKNGAVKFTQIQIDLIIAVTNGGGYKDKASTQHTVSHLIRAATGWQMKATPLMCRFAYKHGLVRL